MSIQRQGGEIGEIFSSLSDPSTSSFVPYSESSFQSKTVVQHYASSFKDDISHKSTFFSSTPNSALDLPIYDEHGHPEADVPTENSVKESQDSNFYQYKDSSTSSKDFTNCSVNFGNNSTNNLNLNNLIYDLLEDKYCQESSEKSFPFTKDVSHQQIINLHEQDAFSHNLFYGFKDSSFEDQDTLDTRGLIQSYQQMLSRTDSSSRYFANVFFGPTSETSSIFIKNVQDLNTAEKPSQVEVPSIKLMESNKVDFKSSEEIDFNEEEEPNQPPETPLIDQRSEDDNGVTSSSSSPETMSSKVKADSLNGELSKNISSDVSIETKKRKLMETELPLINGTSLNDSVNTGRKDNIENQVAQSECLPTQQIALSDLESSASLAFKETVKGSTRGSRGRGRGRGKPRKSAPASKRKDNEVNKQSIIATEISAEADPSMHGSFVRNTQRRKAAAAFNEDLNLVPDINKYRKRSTRCKTCGPCLAPDCGKCIYCLDKPKFGGPNKKKNACIHRKCILLSVNDLQSANDLLSNMTPKKGNVGRKSLKGSEANHGQIPAENGFGKNMVPHDDIPVDIIGHTDNDSYNKTELSPPLSQQNIGRKSDSIANVELSGVLEDASTDINDETSSIFKKREPLVLDPAMIKMLKNCDTKKMMDDIDKDIEKLIKDGDKEDCDEDEMEEYMEYETMIVKDEFLDDVEDVVSMNRRNTGQQ